MCVQEYICQNNSRKKCLKLFFLLFVDLFIHIFTFLFIIRDAERNQRQISELFTMLWLYLAEEIVRLKWPEDTLKQSDPCPLYLFIYFHENIKEGQKYICKASCARYIFFVWQQRSGKREEVGLFGFLLTDSYICFLYLSRLQRDHRSVK